MESKPKLPAASLHIKHADPATRYFLVDSGASVDLIAPEDLTKAENKSKYRPAKPFKLSTANGDIEVQTKVNIDLPGLDIVMKAHVTTDTPPLMSLGRRVLEDGFSFHWEAYSDPILVTPSGLIIRRPVTDFIPLLTPESIIAIAAAVGKKAEKTKPAVPASETTLARALSPISEETGPIDRETPHDELGCNDLVPEGHELTHFPKHPRRPACTRSKIQKTPHRRTSAETKQEKQTGAVKAFGELMTADHIILGNAVEFLRHGDTVSLVVQDYWTQWIASYPDAVKSGAATTQALNLFTKPTDKVLRLYSDSSKEIAKAAPDLGWRHDSCTPHRPQSNGSAERAVRRVLDGARTILFRSGLPHSWWPKASQCYCYLRNITDKVRGYKTPYELRHGVPFPGLYIPFGAALEYLPTSARVIDERLKFSRRTRDGIFQGHSAHSGGALEPRLPCGGSGDHEA